MFCICKTFKTFSVIFVALPLVSIKILRTFAPVSPSLTKRSTQRETSSTIRVFIFSHIQKQGIFLQNKVPS